MTCSQNSSKQSSQTAPLKGISPFNRRSGQSLDHASQMGQGSDLRLGKRTTLFMVLQVGSLASPDARVRNPLVLAIRQSVSFAFRRSTFNPMHLAKRA